MHPTPPGRGRLPHATASTRLAWQPWQSAVMEKMVPCCGEQHTSPESARAAQSAQRPPAPAAAASASMHMRRRPQSVHEAMMLSSSGGSVQAHISQGSSSAQLLPPPPALLSTLTSSSASGLTPKPSPRPPPGAAQAEPQRLRTSVVSVKRRMSQKPNTATVLRPGTMGLMSPSFRMFSAMISAPASPNPIASSAPILLIEFSSTSVSYAPAPARAAGPVAPVSCAASSGGPSQR
ncbi:hypothetical protein TSOC_003892 [Tetrabaena socialis]|uniref:Uncharacterized protein n=1 Tax=Tetrabaena socialis TaxID=47790 RepID=A0A2J8AAB3_9CHLO|nr:hypothetical protein TSOC_003892 [Tetrabaena socialis]|eukprot:PNH09460.1 hypothetical protein TSOC_003892 [Tetrabaena socialis]